MRGGDELALEPLQAGALGRVAQCPDGAAVGVLLQPRGGDGKRTAVVLQQDLDAERLVDGGQDEAAELGRVADLQLWRQA